MLLKCNYWKEILFCFIFLFQNVQSEEDKTFFFKNPLRETGADPWVIKIDDKYYFSESNGNNQIYVHMFSKISEMKVSKPVKVYDSALNDLDMNALWGPHLNMINGEWYIYFCAQSLVDPGFTSQRMWVLKSTTNSPFGPYENKGEVLDSGNTEWAIDGSVLQRANGELYFIWSGIENKDIANKKLIQKTFIAKMKDPTRIDRGTITIISEPTEVWETSVRPIQEGQRPLYVDQKGKTIVMFSANASWTDEYCLGSLTNSDGQFLNPSSWKKSKKPLFKKTDKIFGPGGASYVKSLDGTEDWIIYHAAKYKGAGWNRMIRAQRFCWDESGNPILGIPLDPDEELRLPSGE